jgi:hypothetical protein
MSVPDRTSGYAVGHVVALARHASMSTTYKPALLKALVRIVRVSPVPRISLDKIGAEFLKLYWVQTVVFRLRQAATLVREPEVVHAIRRASKVHRARRLADLPPLEREALEREMARILRINVLSAFHRSKPDVMMPLFDWSPGEDSIGLSSAALEFVSENGSALEALANLWWARYLEKVNLLAPLVIEKVERDGAQRGSLAKYLKILQQVDGTRCFYCERDLHTAVPIHVDHVIPWSFLLSDPPWDLVLACGACNISKSDTLPDPAFLDKLTAAHARRAKLSLPFGFASPLLTRHEMGMLYDAALAVEWPAGWAPRILRP